MVREKQKVPIGQKQWPTMKRKEINIFGTSFLDLLSGALASVIILFIIVPKMSSSQQNALTEIERMNIQIEEIGTLMEQLENSVPQDVFHNLQQRLGVLQQTISSLTIQVDNLQNKLSAVEAENERLRNEVEQLHQHESVVAQLREENQRLQERIQELQNNQPQQDGQGISDGKVFGINAEVGIVCFWRENADIDLHVKDMSSGVECYYNRKQTSFGKLNEDIQSRTASDDDRFELFYQEHPIPGKYEVSLVFFDGQSNRAIVEGYFIMHPGRRNQIKIPYRDIVLTPNGKRPIVIGILTVSNNSINFQQY